MSVRRAGVQSRVRAKVTGVSGRGMHLLLSTGDRNGNRAPCGGDKGSSPDSTRSSSSLSTASSRESPADVEMLDCCLSKEVLSEGFPVAGALTNKGFGSSPFHSSGCGQDEGITRLVYGEKPMSLYLDTKPDNWNDNLDMAMIGLQGNGCHSESSDRSTDASPDSAVNEDGGRASCASVSSGEMPLRSNSFGLSDFESEKPPSTPVLRQSVAPSLAPSEISAASIVLPDACDGLQDQKLKAGVSDVDVGSQRSGIGLFPQRSGEDTYLAIEESPPGLPFETEVNGGPAKDVTLLLSNRECSSPALLCQTYVESESLQCSSGACTPVEGKTFLILGSEDSDTSCGRQTSTPVQGSCTNKTFCLPPESPFRGGSPTVRPPKGRPHQPIQSSPASSRTPVPTPNGRAKTEVKRFLQPDLRNVKSKVMSRPTTPLRASNSARDATTPARPALANRITATGSPVQRKGEAAKGNKSHGSSLTQKGGIQKSRPRRVSECDSAASLKPRKDTLLSSVRREMPTKRSVSISIMTFDTALTPPGQGPQKTTVQGGGDSLGGTVPPSEAEPGVNGTAGNQKVAPASVAASAAAAAAVAAAAAGAATDGGKGRLGPRPSPGRARRASSSSQTPAADLRAPPPAPRASAPSKDGRTSGSMSVWRTKQSPAAGNQKMRLTERPASTAAKPTTGPGTTPPRPVGVSRLPVKSQEHSEPGAATGSAQAPVPAACSRPDGKPARPVEAGAPAARLAGRPPNTRAGGVRGVPQSPQRRASTTGIKNATLPNQTPSKSAASPLCRSSSGRFQRPATTPQVDRSRTRASPRTPAPAPTRGPPDLPPAEAKPPGADPQRARGEGTAAKRLQQLKKLLASGNRRFEAIAVVIQHIVSEHEEAVKQKQALSHELVTLRGQLASSATCCDTLEREKDELRATFEGVIQKVQEQHQSDLADLEERLRGFYSAEWEKVHQAYQEEADKCRSQMQQQLDDFRSKHEALRKELEDSHAENLESTKQHYETTLEELRKTHQEEVETLDKTLKEAEAKLTEQVKELTAENSDLNEKLNAEEERRRILAEKSQKDSHTLYLEQELESLKVVLDIKNKQLHQQDKKLMQMDKLMEKSVKLDECLKKVQQENEDLKARMDKHAALSRQLSTEQAALQESLQKESNVNKRLSMENEELLWKLHNGDLSSPRKLSPTSPSKGFQSPRNSGMFSSPPVSPR